MRVEECMTRQVFACRAETELDQAARLLWEHDCGCLPVVNERDEVVGMLTDRDLCMGAYTQGKALRELSARDSMSKEVFTCRPSDSLEQAIRVMGDHQVRRLPVVDERGRLAGIVSLNDLVRSIVSLSEARGRSSLSARLVEAMGSICEQRGAAPGTVEPVPGPARAYAPGV